MLRLQDSYSFCLKVIDTENKFGANPENAYYYGSGRYAMLRDIAEANLPSMQESIWHLSGFRRFIPTYS